MQGPWGRKEEGPGRTGGAEMEPGRLQRHLGSGRGLGRIPQGVSGPRGGPGPLGHRSQWGVGLACSGRSGPSASVLLLGLTAPALPVRPSLPMAPDAALKEAGGRSARVSQWGRAGPEPARASGPRWPQTWEMLRCREARVGNLDTQFWVRALDGRAQAWAPTVPGLEGDGGSPGGDEHEASPWGCPG